MKKTVEDLKERPKEERTAVAGGVAMTVVVVLLLGWGFFFLKKITRGEPVDTPFGPQQDVIDFSSFESARESFSESYFDATEELRRIRDEAAARQREELEQRDLDDISDQQFGDAQLQGASGFGIE